MLDRCRRVGRRDGKCAHKTSTKRWFREIFAVAASCCLFLYAEILLAETASKKENEKKKKKIATMPWASRRKCVSLFSFPFHFSYIFRVFFLDLYAWERWLSATLWMRRFLCFEEDPNEAKIKSENEMTLITCKFSVLFFDSLRGEVSHLLRSGLYKSMPRPRAARLRNRVPRIWSHLLEA